MFPDSSPPAGQDTCSFLSTHRLWLWSLVHNLETTRHDGHSIQARDISRYFTQESKENSGMTRAWGPAPTAPQSLVNRGLHR